MASSSTPSATADFEPPVLDVMRATVIYYEGDLLRMQVNIEYLIDKVTRLAGSVGSIIPAEYNKGRVEERMVVKLEGLQLRLKLMEEKVSQLAEDDRNSDARREAEEMLREAQTVWPKEILEMNGSIREFELEIKARIETVMEMLTRIGAERSVFGGN